MSPSPLPGPLLHPPFAECPIRNVLSRVGNKWALLVLYTLQQHPLPLRFSTLRRAIPDISQKELARTLRQLEEDGFVRRTVYAEVPPRVEYALQDRGTSFMEACQPILYWAKEHLACILTDREQAQKKRGITD